MASDEQFSLCWNNFHANMSAGFHGLLSRGDLVDVTLAAEGRLLQAHKLVLSVCSPYFQEMFKMNPTQHPIVFLKDVSHSALRDLLQFMYQGEVNVKQEELASFISTAEQLQVKGLTGNQNEESSTPSKPKPTSRPGPRSSQQRQSVMTKLETDLDSKPSSTPVAVKRPNRPSIASNNSSSSQSGPAKRKCVDPLEAGPSGSAKDEFVTIPDEDENNAVAPKMEPEFVNESMWDDDEDGANNEETNFGEDDSNMEMTGFDGSTTGDGNITGGGEGGAVGDAQESNFEGSEDSLTVLSDLDSVFNDDMDEGHIRFSGKRLPGSSFEEDSDNHLVPLETIVREDSPELFEAAPALVGLNNSVIDPVLSACNLNPVLVSSDPNHCNPSNRNVTGRQDIDDAGSLNNSMEGFPVNPMTVTENLEIASHLRGQVLRARGKQYTAVVRDTRIIDPFESEEESDADEDGSSSSTIYDPHKQIIELQNKGSHGRGKQIYEQEEAYERNDDNEQPTVVSLPQDEFQPQTPDSAESEQNNVQFDHAKYKSSDIMYENEIEVTAEPIQDDVEAQELAESRVLDLGRKKKSSSPVTPVRVCSTSDHDVLFTYSSRGKPILIVKGITYRKNGYCMSKIRWRCATHEKYKCHAKIHTLNNTVIVLSNEHRTSNTEPETVVSEMN
ncbi:uncharacterized protein LOC142976394 isoform X2 [Anticarsia gemmatalis]|uniref:uncharacterized protein LOC142976394 isoform X2 n=1 Tax=Anticarsia gemmatalis TaxID=129554 RepID=UPI003F7656D4